MFKPDNLFVGGREHSVQPSPCGPEPKDYSTECLGYQNEALAISNSQYGVMV